MCNTSLIIQPNRRLVYAITSLARPPRTRNTVLLPLNIGRSAQQVSSPKPTPPTTSSRLDATPLLPPERFIDVTFHNEAQDVQNISNMLVRAVVTIRVPVVTTHPDHPNLLSGAPANRTFCARLLPENVVCDKVFLSDMSQHVIPARQDHHAFPRRARYENPRGYASVLGKRCRGKVLGFSNGERYGQRILPRRYGIDPDLDAFFWRGLGMVQSRRVGAGESAG
ncbi:hypothetical protein E5D57_009442 [Metarhizium anisopliae]|nr:hypothetical protein E5D57_009442 [Metarhizium anisopliae]